MPCQPQREGAQARQGRTHPLGSSSRQLSGAKKTTSSVGRIRRQKKAASAFGSVGTALGS